MITDIIDFNEDYYAILGITRDDLPTGKDPNSKRLANDILRRAYHKKLFEVHPDRPDGDEEKCKMVVKAHSILGDPILRNVYSSGGVNYADAIKDGIQINWDQLGKYRKGSLADMIGSALYEKMMNSIANIEEKFVPCDETCHNYHWEFWVDGLEKELVLSIVEDESEVLRLTSGDENSLNNALPFKIYLCLPSIKFVMTREAPEFQESEGYLDIIKGKIMNARFIDADIFGTTNYDNAVEFIESGKLQEAINQCIDGNIEQFIKKFKMKTDDSETAQILKKQEVYKRDQTQLKELMGQAGLKN